MACLIPASGMSLRGTFIIDATGIIRYVVVNPRGQARDLAGIPRGTVRTWPGLTAMERPERPGVGMTGFAILPLGPHG